MYFIDALAQTSSESTEVRAKLGNLLFHYDYFAKTGLNEVADSNT